MLFLESAFKKRDAEFSHINLFSHYTKFMLFRIMELTN
ncbi:hypothetical protein LEP1GSC020_0307 [Leptospira interrogans serovar Grippotyphosa str. 2006006986]|nr:hypothetical protein LEP1GSC020_0307 [Leptospira interrogans serovar Grippotyphosa str. 2006006986]